MSDVEIRYTRLTAADGTDGAKAPFINANTDATGAVEIPNADKFALHVLHFKPGSSAVAFNIQYTGVEDANGDPTGWVDLLDTDITTATSVSNRYVEVTGPRRHLQVKWSGSDAAVTVTLEQVGRLKDSSGVPL